PHNANPAVRRLSSRIRETRRPETCRRKSFPMKSTLRASARYPMCCSRPIWYSLTLPAPDWKISCDMPRMLDILRGKFLTRSIKGHPHPLVCASSSREYMKPFAILLVAFVLLSSTLLGCRRSSSSSVSEGAPAAPWFADVSEQAGLSFVHDAG